MADVAGHYNRPDVFQLRVAAASPKLFTRDDPQFGETKAAHNVSEIPAAEAESIG